MWRSTSHQMDSCTSITKRMRPHCASRPVSVVVLGGSCITALTLDCCTSMYKPVATSVHEKLAVAGCDDEDFMDLIDWLLTLDPQARYGLWGAVCMLLCTL